MIQGDAIPPVAQPPKADTEALRGLVAYGFGVSILSDLVYRPWSLEGKKIIALPVQGGLDPMEVGMLWAPGKEPGGLADIFRQFLIHACDAAELRPAAG